MIASKLILFFCFYLLLDNSLGKEKTLLEKPKYINLLKQAIKYGDTYGGELEELGSQWTNLIQEIAQGNREVGLGRYQLATFKELDTEEFGLGDTYADNITSVVAIRTHDLDTSQKHLDDLEIEKNKIALSMIAKMEEIKKKYKKKNVREKVKEAKANGITDTDIKEILFADFFHSGGLSLISRGASVVKELLSSIRGGMDSLLGGSYFGKLGTIQHGNVTGSCLPFGNCDDAGNDGAPGGDAGGGGDGAPGVAPGGGTGGGDAPEGNPPGGGRGPPDGPPDDGPPGEEGEEEDEPGGAAGGENDNPFGLEEDADFFEEIRARYPQIRVNSAEAIALWILNNNNQLIQNISHDIEPGPSRENPSVENTSGTLEELVQSGENPFAHDGQGPPQFLVQQRDVATERVNLFMKGTIMDADYFDEQIERLESDFESRYTEKNPSLQISGRVSVTERVNVYTRRIVYLETLLDKAKSLRKDLIKFSVKFRKDLGRTLYNFDYYSLAVQADDAVVDPSLVLPDQPPPPLAEFRINEHDTMRYLISRIRLNRLYAVRMNYGVLNHALRQMRFRIQKELEDLEENIVYYNLKLSEKKE